MNGLEHIGFEPAWERELFLLELNSIDNFLANIDVKSCFFACLIVFNATDVPRENIRILAKKLLNSGAVYFVIWGPDSERVHDVIDEISEEYIKEKGLAVDSCIMTTWYEKDPLEKAIWDFLHVSLPDEIYINETRASLAILVDHPDWAMTVRDALKKTDHFTQCYVDRAN